VAAALTCSLDPGLPPPHDCSPPPSPRRLELAVIGGCLWHRECQAAAAPLPSHIPVDFEDAAHYVATFEPLLHEEARGSVQSAYQEARKGGRHWAVQVARWEQVSARACRLGTWGAGQARARSALGMQLKLLGSWAHIGKPLGSCCPGPLAGHEPG
jgi:hypothetical protein